MSTVEALARDRSMAAIAHEQHIDLERLRYWVRVGLVRVYRSDRVWYVRRVDEEWIRQLATLIDLGVSIDALVSALRAGLLGTHLKALATAARRAQVPEWLELHG